MFVIFVLKAIKKLQSTQNKFSNSLFSLYGCKYIIGTSLGRFSSRKGRQVPWDDQFPFSIAEHHQSYCSVAPARSSFHGEWVLACFGLATEPNRGNRRKVAFQATNSLVCSQRKASFLPSVLIFPSRPRGFLCTSQHYTNCVLFYETKLSSWA